MKTRRELEFTTRGLTEEPYSVDNPPPGGGGWVDPLCAQCVDKYRLHWQWKL